MGLAASETEASRLNADAQTPKCLSCGEPYITERPAWWTVEPAHPGPWPPHVVGGVTCLQRQLVGAYWAGYSLGRGRV